MQSYSFDATILVRFYGVSHSRCWCHDMAANSQAGAGHQLLPRYMSARSLFLSSVKGKELIVLSNCEIWASNNCTFDGFKSKTPCVRNVPGIKVKSSPVYRGEDEHNS